MPGNYLNTKGSVPPIFAIKTLNMNIGKSKAAKLALKYKKIIAAVYKYIE